MKEKQLFIASILAIYKKYTGGSCLRCADSVRSRREE